MLLQYVLGVAFIAGGGNGRTGSAAAATTTAAMTTTTTTFVPPHGTLNRDINRCVDECRIRDRRLYRTSSHPTHPSSSSSSTFAIRRVEWSRRPGSFGGRPLPVAPPPMMLSSTNNGGFYDDFEDFADFGEIGGGGSGSQSSSEGNNAEMTSGVGNNGGGDFDVGAGGGDAVMRELRARMKDLSRLGEQMEDEEEEEEEEEEEYDDSDSGSALPDLEGSKISSIDDLIGFAQARAREKARERGGDGTRTTMGDAAVGGTWEDENWARPVPLIDEDTGENIDIESLLEGGIVLIANPARFCSDLAMMKNDDGNGNGDGDGDGDGDGRANRGKKDKFLGGLFDDPFPAFGASSSRSSSSGNGISGGISPALLAKFGITLPPSPDLGPDRRADLLPVVLLIDRDPVRGCQAVLMNRRTGNLMGDLPANVFDTTRMTTNPDDDGDGSPPSPPTSHPLSAFMIQPLWWAGSSPGGNMGGNDGGPSRRGVGGGGGISAIDMVHACPYVNGSVPLPMSDGLYWGGSPVQAQEAMKDSRLERPLSGFDFKFFIQTTRWLPSQLEQEIKDGVWYPATVSKEVLFRSRDRLGAKRAKPLWTEIIELLGDDYRHIRDQLYGEGEV